jgi:hypothetical protein
LVGGGLGSLFGGSSSSPQNTGVTQSTQNAVAGNTNNLSNLASLLSNNFSGIGSPLAGTVGNIYQNTLNSGVNPSNLTQVLSQLNPNQNSVLSGLMSNITTGQLPSPLMNLISAMNPQTNITQEQGALSDQLQTAFAQAQEAQGLTSGGTLPSEGAGASLGQSYLQNTATAGADLQSQIAAQQASAAGNQFNATLSGLGQQQNAISGYLAPLLEYLNASQGLLTGGQNAANQNAFSPNLALAGTGSLEEILNSLASGQSNAFQNQNAGLSSLVGQVTNQFPNGLLASLFGNGDNGINTSGTFSGGTTGALAAGAGA